jgi:hypothetical protein
MNSARAILVPFCVSLAIIAWPNLHPGRWLDRKRRKDAAGYLTLTQAVAQFQQEKLLALSFQLSARQGSGDR